MMIKRHKQRNHHSRHSRHNNQHHSNLDNIVYKIWKNRFGISINIIVKKLLYQSKSRNLQATPKVFTKGSVTFQATPI